MPARRQPLRIAIDTGGTFTDCIWIDPRTRRLRMLKVFSTPADPSQAIVDAIGKILSGMRAKRVPGDSPELEGMGSRPGSQNFILLHGTTVGTNTLLERKGARTALVTTAGFEDVIEIGRQARPKLYDFFFDRVEPLVPNDLRFGLSERTAADGEILTAPTPDQLQNLVSRAKAAYPESVAICFLFSFANPKNEQAAAGALQKLKVPLSISHEILPEFREYERTSTVVINAYLQPAMQRYLENLQAGCDAQSPAEGRGHKPRIFVMQSSGGITSLATAAREPVRTVLSGPAGGVVGALTTARASGFEKIIAFDMGGTSTDASLVEGEIKLATDAQIAGLPVGVPMLDIHTVGAGGGSLARFDAGGALRVGPESAGAAPGPICYGRGEQPTVTDANLLLGRLQPAKFLGGDFTLDLDRTRRLTRKFLRKQGSDLSLEQFAAGIVSVVNATMEKALRVVSIERGRDPRDFALVAFGGAGGLHACALAEALSIPRVVIPAFPGALSALGILASDVVKDYSRTVVWRVSQQLPHARLNREFSALERNAARDFSTEDWRGKPRFLRSIDLRYRGQGYELNLPFTKNLLRDFTQEHQRRYGYAYPDREIEFVTLRLRAVLKSPTGNSGTAAPGRAVERSLTTRRHSEAAVYFHGKKELASIYSREELRPRRYYSGPAIITEYSATTVVPPKKRFQIDKASSLMIYMK